MTRFQLCSSPKWKESIYDINLLIRSMEIKFEGPTVFLFGAGATRGAFSNSHIPPPLDRDFFDIANKIKGHGTPKLAKKVLKDVWKLNSRVNDVGLEEYYRDIETREKIGKFAKTKHKPKDWQTRKEDLDELIRRVMIQTTCDPDLSPLQPFESQVHQELLANIVEGDTLITFNYDTLIEESFETAVIWSPNGGYGDDVHGVNLEWSKNWFSKRKISSRTKSKVVLLKLHGSLNWALYPNRQVRIKPKPYMVRTNRNNTVYENVAILPPGWNKKIDKNPFKELWHQARLRLEKCKSLVIIGYSLPETDLLAKALFNEVVRTRVGRKKSSLKNLYLVDPSKSTMDRFVNLFVPTLGSTGKIYRFNDFASFVK